MSFDVSRESLQRTAKKAADLYTEVYADLENRRVDPGVSREHVAQLFAGTIGEQGVGIDQALDEFQRDVLPNSMGTPHPLYLGLVNSSPLPAGPLADLLVSSLNNNGGAFHQSPAITALEAEVLREFGRLCRLGEDASGMILPGGTFANLHALLLARHAHFPKWHSDGPQSLQGPPVIYRSEVAHFCIDRAAAAIGIGAKNIANVPLIGRGMIDVEALDKQIAQDRAAGKQPFCVVANGGTTGTGAIDDTAAIAELCKRHGLWMHVDACYGGAALLLDPPLHEFDGIGQADSIAIDPHKWFFMPITAGMVLTPHRQVEVEAFEIATSYIPGDGVVDPFRRGFPTSRRSSGLTVWMTLRAHGWNTIREAVERNIQLTRRIEQQLGEAGFHVLKDGRLSVACARWEPDGLIPAELDELQARIAQAVVATGKAWFSTVNHEDKTWLRMNMVNIHTREHHVDALTQLLQDVAADCASVC